MLYLYFSADQGCMGRGFVSYLKTFPGSPGALSQIPDRSEVCVAGTVFPGPDCLASCAPAGGASSVKTSHTDAAKPVPLKRIRISENSLRTLPQRLTRRA